jgi:L-threonylcarbamoyladenylate synthase
LRHYAPNARLILTKGSEEGLSAALNQADSKFRNGVLLPADWQVRMNRFMVQRWAEWTDADGLAATLFVGLRALDASGAEQIYCPLPDAGGLRDAIRDRLEKAARQV